MSSCFPKIKKGFTAIEILCVLIIVSIVTSIALPSINNFYSSERCKAEASILVDYIRQAKYQAMQDNTLNRIIFSEEDGTYKVQRYEPGEADGSELDIDSTISDDASSPSIKYLPSDDNHWASIADTEELEFNSAVEVNIASFITDVTKTYGAIYFKPDGYIYNYIAPKVSLLSEKRITFKYGNAAIAVDVNALGVISSEVIQNNEDDENYFNDNYDKEPGSGDYADDPDS